LDLGLTAGAVAHRIDEYTFVQTHMPLLWARHQNGRIDAWRLHIIAETTRDTLTDPASYTILDEKLAAWLSGRATYTPGQLRAWLRRTVAHLEPEHQRDRTHRSWDQRNARVTHDDDGTAQLFSVLSSEDGIAIDDLNNQLARADIIADLLLGRTTLDRQTASFGRLRRPHASAGADARNRRAGSLRPLDPVAKPAKPAVRAATAARSDVPPPFGLLAQAS